MRSELLPYLVSPVTQKPLRMIAEEAEGDDVLTGKLVAEGSGEEFPIIKGIPRFVGTAEQAYKTYAASFGHQWNQYEWLRDEDQLEFESITDRPVAGFAGMTVLDAGCGGGRIARFLAPATKMYIGVDYSHAPERARKLCQGVKHAHFIQADVNHMPFRKEPKFDFILSHGVLHHSPNTYRSFLNLPPLLRPGGELYIAVFRKAFLPLQWPNAFWRAIISRLPLSWQECWCRSLLRLRGMPFASFFKRFFWFSQQKDDEVATCCNYDWYAPRYHWEHTATEVMNWFADAGFHEVQYINAWPYCPPEQKYFIPGFLQSFRLGQLLGVIGRKKKEAASHDRQSLAA
jgi:SAM-dependent methyltransferase